MDLPLSPLERRRELAIDQLTKSYADEYLDTSEFEDKIAQVNIATSIRSLEKVLSDLPAEYQLPTARKSSGMPGTAAPASPVRNLTTIMGSNSFGAELIENRSVSCFNLMGDSVFDLRAVQIPDGELHLQINCIMGDIKIMLPPDVAVRNQATSIMADAKVKGAPGPDPRCTLTITGFQLMADLKIRY